MLHEQKFFLAFEESDTPPRTRVEGAYLALRRDIIEGRRAPGEKLRVEHLKDEYGVGAGTLREAFSLLVSDALVVAEGQRGFRVTPMSLEDLRDITQTRILLETEAIRLSLRAADARWEAGVLAAWHRLTRAEEQLGRRSREKVREWELCNQAFHESLIANCDSRWLRYLLGIVYRQSERYRHLTISNRGAPRDVHAEHAAIFEAAMAGNVKQASAAVARHIGMTFETVQQLRPDLQQASANMASERRAARQSHPVTR
jgi:DNA-binding GntR family transcriptional regulator